MLGTVFQVILLSIYMLAIIIPVSPAHGGIIQEKVNF